MLLCLDTCEDKQEKTSNNLMLVTVHFAILYKILYSIYIFFFRRFQSSTHTYTHKKWQEDCRRLLFLRQESGEKKWQISCWMWRVRASPQIFIHILKRKELNATLDIVRPNLHFLAVFKTQLNIMSLLNSILYFLLTPFSALIWLMFNRKDKI